MQNMDTHSCYTMITAIGYYKLIAINLNEQVPQHKRTFSPVCVCLLDAL